MITNAQLRLTLAAIRNVLRAKGVEDILANIGKKELRIEELPDDKQPALNIIDYAAIFTYIDTKNPSAHDRLMDKPGKNSLQLIGRAYFQEILRQKNTLTGFSKVLMGLWTEEKRIKFVLESIRDVQKKLVPQSELILEEENGVFVINDYNCLVCMGQHGTTYPICEFTVGLLQESVAWATGINFTIEETHCRAREDNCCRFTISRFPTKASSN